MPVTSAPIVTKHSFELTSGTNIIQLNTILDIFDSIDFVLWDSEGFISKSSVRPGVRRKEDAMITLSVVGLLGSQVMIATINFAMLLPFGKYKTYEQVPISLFETVRVALVTHIGTTKSLTLLDGKIV